MTVIEMLVKSAFICLLKFSENYENEQKNKNNNQAKCDRLQF